MTEDKRVCYAVSSPRTALAWTTLAFFAGFSGVSAFGPIVPKLKQAMEAGPLLMGILAASPALTGSLLRIPFGAMVDRMGGKKPIVILLLLAAAGVAGMTLMFSIAGTPRAVHYPFFLVCGILCGCGIAVFSVGVPAVSYWYPQRKQGTALAVYGGLGNLAPGIFALLLPLLVVNLGFIASYLLWLAALLAMTGLVFVRMKDAPYFQYKQMGMAIDPEALLLACGEELIPSGKAMDSIRKAGADWRTWVLTFLYFISFGGFIALTVWFPTFWTERFQIDLVKAGLFTSAFSLAASLLRVVGGIAADRFGGLLVAQLSLAVIAAGAMVIVAAEGSLRLAFAGQMVLALGMGVGNAAVFKLVPRFTPQAVGGAAGIIGGLGAFGGFALPPVMGLFVRLTGETGYGQGFWVFLGLALVGLALLAALQRCTQARLP
ncbi:MAG: MFS transporter [Desulfobacterales bacterium]|jgi:NNP family nitrate/nitrite transporter-like MFS transporter|nr:MFS transporter [Desulfobacterales bacterium]